MPRIRLKAPGGIEAGNGKDQVDQVQVRKAIRVLQRRDERRQDERLEGPR